MTGTNLPPENPDAYEAAEEERAQARSAAIAGIIEQVQAVIGDGWPGASRLHL